MKKLFLALCVTVCLLFSVAVIPVRAGRTRRWLYLRRKRNGRLPAGWQRAAATKRNVRFKERRVGRRYVFNFTTGIGYHANSEKLVERKFSA